MKTEKLLIDELEKAADLAHDIQKKVMDECPSVARGLMGTAIAMVILSKSNTMEIELDRLIDMLCWAHEIVEQSAEKDGDGEDHVLQ